MITVLIYCLISICILSGLFGILECIFVIRFFEKLFEVGKVVFRNEIELSLDKESIEIESIYKKKYGSYKFISTNECLYYTTYSLGQFDFFPIKGRINWNGGLAKIDGRMYLGIISFLITWLAIWTVGGIIFITHSFLIGLCFTIIGWIFIGGIFYFGLKFGRRYEFKIIKEVKTQFC